MAATGSGVRLDVRLDGWERLVASLASVAPEQRVRQFLDSTGLLLRDEARRRAPVNSGVLRSQIFHEVDSAEPPQWVDVGAMPHYAKYMEFGTGLRHDHPNWPRKRHFGYVLEQGAHWQPVPGLVYWAKRKGMGAPESAARGLMVAIARRGGLDPRRYLRGPIEDLRGRVADRWASVFSGIVRDVSGGL